MVPEWSVFAIIDRETIFDYIEAENPSAAMSIDERIERAVARLAEFPKAGRGGRVEGTRELIIPGTPYLAIYRISARKVRILRILH